MRRGFTLVEMLVAATVFVVGFVGVFGLFLAGMRFRKQSEDLTRCSLAASSLVAEFRIDAGRENPSPSAPPKEPVDYLGDGFAGNAPEAAQDGVEGRLYPYLAMPGMWYRVENCSDAVPPPDSTDPTREAEATALRMRLLVLPFATADTALTLQTVARRLQLRDADDALFDQPTAIADELHRRGIALRTEVVLVRTPHWMR